MNLRLPCGDAFLEFRNPRFELFRATFGGVEVRFESRGLADVFESAPGGLVRRRVVTYGVAVPAGPLPCLYVRILGPLKLFELDAKALEVGSRLLRACRSGHAAFTSPEQGTLLRVAACDASA